MAEETRSDDEVERANLVINIPPRRKISLPWFRQSSIADRFAVRKKLPKQHTIASTEDHDGLCEAQVGLSDNGGHYVANKLPIFAGL